MKTQIIGKILAVISLALLAGPATAQNAVQLPLPDGAAQVLQLEQAKVREDTILAYIRASGKDYPLDAQQILYLRKQGVSDTVVKAMLSQPKSDPAKAPSTPPTLIPPASLPTAGAAPAPATVQASSIAVPPNTPTGVVLADAGPPPPLKVEVVPVAPGPLSLWFWTPGRWEWRGHWVWVGGCWALRPHPGAVWIGGGWRWFGPRHVWVEAHWR